MTSVFGNTIQGQDVSPGSNPSFESTEVKYTEYCEIDTPDDPAIGKERVYTKSDGNLYILDSAGNETIIESGSNNLQSAYEGGNTITTTTAVPVSLVGTSNIDSVFEVKNISGAARIALDGYGRVQASDQNGNVFVGIGVGSQYNISLGQATANVAVGSGALLGLSTSDANVAIGTSSMINADACFGNCCVGDTSGKNITSANYNTCIGRRAAGIVGGPQRVLGDNNTLIGADTGFQFDGGVADITAIGRNCGLGGTGISNTTMVGSETNVTGEYGIAIGKDAVSIAKTCTIGGPIVGNSITEIRAGDDTTCSLGSSSYRFTDLNMTGDLNLYNSGGGVNYIRLKAPALSVNSDYTLPDEVASLSDSLLTCDVSGNLNWYEPHIAIIRQSGQVSMPTGLPVSVGFNTNEFIRGLSHSTTVNNSLITSNKPGYYQVSYSIYWQPSASNDLRLSWIGVNAQTGAADPRYAFVIEHNIGGNSKCINGSATMRISNGDYIQLWVQHGTATSLDHSSADNAFQTRIQVAWLSP